MALTSYVRSFALVGLVTIIMLSASQNAIAAPSTVWRIGIFDHSSDEFNQGSPSGSGGNYSLDPPVFVVGKSKPGNDWYAFQPGSFNGKDGHREHPYAIRFDLPNAPRGLYTLKAALLVSVRSRLSILQIEINGRKGWAYQRPQWHNVLGDKYWADDLEVELPTSALKKGINRLILTAIDESDSFDKFSDPGLTYDALELDQDTSQHFASSKVTVNVEPTIFYQQKSGGLVELVNTYLHHNSAFRQRRVNLTLGGKQFAREFAPGRDFGEEMIQFSVPEFASGTKGEVFATVNGKSQHFPLVLTPARKWELLVVPHEHLDVGYTDYQGKVAAIQSRVLDEAIQMIHDHPDFRYSTDGYWVYQQYMAGHNDEDQQKLLQLIKDHKLFVPAQYANLLTAFPTAETLIRSLYPSFQLDRAAGGNFDYANITDVPSYTWSYASVMAAAGLKYFLAGSDQIRGPILMLGDLQERSPFWWQGPDGGRVLMWYSYGYGQVGEWFGMPPKVLEGRDALPRYLQAYSTPEYKIDTVLMFGAQGENSDLLPQQASIAQEWNNIYAYPKMVYTDVASALREIAGQLGNSIPVIKGDGGPYWEDGIYSDAYYAALARKSEQRAPSAEKISTISSLVHPSVKPDVAALDQLWQDMFLFDEHTWGAGESISSPESQEEVQQLAVKRAFATQAEQKLDYVMQRGMAAISDYINDPEGTLVVFNPLNWQRSGSVELDLPKGSEFVDQANGTPVAYQILPRQSSDRADAPFQRIRFIAKDVPPLGYRCYRERSAKLIPLNPPASMGTTLENSYYRVVLDGDRGAVTSIFDKELNRELVNASSPYRFDEYLYVTGGEGSLLYSDEPQSPPPALTIHGAQGGHVLSIERTPFGTVARLVSSDTNTPRIETDITLFDSQKKIEFVNHVQKEKVYTKEAVYFSFPFAMDHPQFRYDIQNGLVDPSRDLLPGAAREWFSTQHWIAAQQNDLTVALIPADAELFTLGDIVRGKWPMQFGQRPGTIFSYVMNNYWFTNYVAGQGGDFSFRYVLTSGRNIEPGQLSRLGWEEMTPLETNEITGSDKEVARPGPLNADEGSFLQVNQPNVVLVNWKTAEDGHGTILRFLELAGKSAQVSVRIPVLQIKSAWKCTAMEENQQPLSTSAHGVTFSVTPFQIVTVRVESRLPQ